MSAMFSYRFKQSLRFPLFLLVVIWLIHGLQMISGGSLSALGVLPGHKNNPGLGLVLFRRDKR